MSEVYKAITKVMEKLSKVGISKNKTASAGGGGSYKFRGIDDVYNALAPHMAEAGLCILPRVKSRSLIERVSAKGNALFYVTLDVEFDFVAASDGSKHTVEVYGEAMDSGDKATNKAMSAAFKYACMEVFCIPTEGDNDPDATVHEVAASQDQKEVNRYVSSLTDALNSDVEEPKRAEIIYNIRQELNGQNELMDAIWERLEARQKRAIRLYIDQHGKTIAAAPAAPNGR